MAKLHLPKLNSWVTPLVLASIGLHGLVLALPMPDLAESPPERPEPPEPEVIQVVTLPKLADELDAAGQSLPEPLPEQELPPPEPVDARSEEIIVTEPEILDEIEPALDETEIREADDQPINSENSNGGEPSKESTLEQRLASRDSYANYDGSRTGDLAALTKIGELFESDNWPDPFRELVLPPIDVPLQECLPEPPGPSVSFAVEVGPDGQLTGDPMPLNSAGYEVLDEKALELALLADYAAHHPAGKTKSYSFAIPINYQACNTASLSNTQTSS